jgi:hypothetical protein
MGAPGTAGPSEPVRKILPIALFRACALVVRNFAVYMASNPGQVEVMLVGPADQFRQGHGDVTGANGLVTGTQWP